MILMKLIFLNILEYNITDLSQYFEIYMVAFAPKFFIHEWEVT